MSVFTDYGEGRPVDPLENLKWGVDDLKAFIRRSGERESELAQQAEEIAEKVRRQKTRVEEAQAMIVKYEHAIEVLTRKGFE